MRTARRSWRCVATAPVYTPSIVHTIRPTPVSRSRAIRSLWKIAEEVRSRHCPLPHVLFFGGGVVIKLGDETIGAIGASGAPGAKLDDACARSGLDKIRDRLK